MKAICFGEVLWDIVGDKQLVGGAPLNVCYHLSKYGINSKVVSQIGNDIEGRNLRTEINQLGVNTDLISISETYPTSKVLVNVAEKGNVDYEIIDNIAWDYISFDSSLIPIIKQSDVFVFGSLVARHNLSRETLLTYLKHARWKVFDINLRNSNYCFTVIEKLLKQCDTLKINEEELKVLSKWMSIDYENTFDCLAAICKMLTNIYEIVLTRGEEGALYFSKNQQIETLGIPTKVKDTIGCGDSFLAAFIANKLAGKTIQECLQQAVRLSSYVASQAGGCPVYKEGLLGIPFFLKH